MNPFRQPTNASLALYLKKKKFSAHKLAKYWGKIIKEF